MTPRTAKRRVMLRVAFYVLYVDGHAVGRIDRGTGGPWAWLSYVGDRHMAGQEPTRAAARRALLRACAAEKKENRK